MPFKLLLRNLMAHPLRSILTVGSVAAAVFLICLLHAAVAGLTKTLEQAASNRMFVQSAVSLFVDLPYSYESKMTGVPGVEAICKWQWFGGRYERDKDAFFAQFAVDPPTFGPTYPELEIVEGSYDAFAKKRTSCIVGKDLVDKYGWRLGQNVPLIGTIFQRTDGRPWEFEIAAVYRPTKSTLDAATLWFHFDYLKESLEAGGSEGPRGVGVYLLRLAPGADPVQVAGSVDALFENGPQRVQATTEAEFNRQFISMLGDVPALLKLIGGAVLFAIFFAVLNTMLMAGRERTRDIGVMKALGFSDGVATALLVCEGVLLCGIGALLALGFAKAVEAPFQVVLGPRLPGFEFDAKTLGLGAAIALGIGLVSGLLPGWRAGRLRAVEAMREVG